MIAAEGVAGALLGCLACAVSAALTGLVRRQAIVHALLDVPNERSSHTAATPRGGGLAIVVTTTIALFAFAAFHWLGWRVVWGVSGAGALVALVGFADDRRGVAARWRLAGHFLAGAWLLAMLGGAPPLEAAGVSLGSGWLGAAVALLYIVWILNLTNFMDGIDGIAAVETITVCLGATALSAIAAPGQQLWIGPVALAGAAAGFAAWNWPPAKIFMGDVGSGFLGFTFAAFSLQAGWVESRLFWCWVVLLGVFVVDATVTLFRRLVRRQRVWEAHRSHAYQHAAVRRGRHAPVTLAVGVVNLVWLFPVAWFVATGRIDGLLGVAIAYVPLIVAAVLMNAGVASA